MKLKLRNIAIEFLDDGHTYTLGGQLIPGTTTILKSLGGKEYLIGWAAKEAVGYLADKQDKIKELSPEEYTALLQEAKSSFRRKSKEASDIGSVVHEYLEKYVKAKIAGEELKDVLPDNDKVKNSFMAFLAWESEHKVEWLASELILASPTHLFGGTIDWVAKVDNVLTLGDFKTSNQISEEYALQLAAYHILLDENLLDGEERPAQRYILRIPKGGEEFETQRVDTDLKFDMETFLRLRETHKWRVYIENNFTEKVGQYKKTKLQHD